MAIAIAVIIAVGVLVYVFSRLQQRTRALGGPDQETPQPRKSRRQRKLEQLREADPLPEPKPIHDIMMEEAADLGIDRIPGGDGIDMPIRLKVFRRDEAVRTGCAGELRYEVATGVDPADATVDDVRLVCVGLAEEDAGAESAEPEPPLDDAEDAEHDAATE